MTTEADAPALLTLDQMIDYEADCYRRFGTLAADMIARHLAELASMVRFIQAATSEQAIDRITTLERDRLSAERNADRRDRGAHAVPVRGRRRVGHIIDWLAS